MSDIQNTSAMSIVLSLNFVSTFNRYIFLNLTFMLVFLFSVVSSSFLFAFGILYISSSYLPYLLFISLLHSYI